MTLARVSDTLGPLGRVPTCTGAHFRILLIFWSAEGKGYPKENPVFLKDLQEKESELRRNRKRKTNTKERNIEKGRKKKG